MKTYYVTPSDITFLWSDCPRCFYKKVALGKPRPSGPFPTIFSRIDKAMKDCYVGKNLRDISADFPDAVIEYPDQWVQSAPLAIRGKDIQIVFRGKVDGILKYNELTEGGKPVYGVSNFKTVIVDDSIAPMYWLAIHACVYCLENPAKGEMGLPSVDKMGLIVFEPGTYEHLPNQEPEFKGTHYWLEFEKDMPGFMDWMKTLAKVLCEDEAPEATENCSYCRA